LEERVQLKIKGKRLDKNHDMSATKTVDLRSIERQLTDEIVVDNVIGELTKKKKQLFCRKL
jgi:hypothetical protein